MKEFEYRFKIEQNSLEELRQKLVKLKFRRIDSFKRADIVFEKPEFAKLTKPIPGYFGVRIRMKESDGSKLEVKEFISRDTCNETSISIDNPKAAFDILSKILVPRRIISGTREMWKNKNVEVVIDFVNHLGWFVEIEGPKKSVQNLCSELKFDVKRRSPVYGHQLNNLQRAGKLSFNEKDFYKTLNNFRK